MESILQQIIASPQLLSQGEVILRQQLKNPNNRKSLLQVFYQCKNRNYIVLVQNIYPDLWESIDKQQKEFTRRALLKMLHQKYNHPKDIEALALFVTKIHNNEGYQHWANLYIDLISLGITQKLLEFLLVIFRSQDDRISIINPSLMQKLVLSLQNPNNSPIYIEKLLISLYYIIKRSSFLQGTNDQLFNAILGGSNAPWLYSIYQNILKSDKVHLHKLILQQLTNLFSDAPKYAFSVFEPMINLIWMYFNNLVPVYIKENVVIQGTEKAKSISDEYIFGVRFQQQTTLSEGLTYQSLQLIESIFLHKSMKKLMRFGIYPILSTMTSLLLVTKRDQKQWLHQENKFIADTEDEGMVGIRNRVVSFINLLIEDRYKGVIQILKLIINNSFNNGNLISLKAIFNQDIISKNIMAQLDEKILSKSQQLQHIFQSSFINVEVNNHIVKQSVTLLLLSFASDLLPAIEDKNILFQKLRLEVETSSYPLLKIQALNTLVRCAQQISIQHIPNFLAYALNSLQSPYPGLRVISIKSIGVFCRKLRLSPIQTNHILISQSHIQKVVKQIKSFSQETVHVFLDTCIELTKFSLQCKQTIIRYLQNLVEGLVQTSMTDGLMASQLIQLLGGASSANIQHYFMVRLQQTLNVKGMEQISDLCLRILEANLQNHIWKYSNSTHINQFISSNVKNQKLSLLISQFLRTCQISQQTLNICISNIQPIWFIPLHQRGVTLNVVPILKQSIDNVISLTSPSEVEKQLTLPFYLLWNNYQETINTLKTFNLYDQFVKKWLRYQQTFKGSVLKKVSLILSSKLAQSQYQQQVNQYITRQRDCFLRDKQIISKIQPEWQDEQDENQQQGQCVQNGLYLDEAAWFDGDLVNKIVQKQLISAIKGVESINIQEIIQNRANKK